MKQVIKYQSESGFIFDTVDEAEREDAIFAEEKIRAKALDEPMYIHKNIHQGFVQLLNGEVRKV